MVAVCNIGGHKLEPHINISNVFISEHQTSATWNAFSHSHPSVFMEMKYTKKGILNFGVT